MGQSRNKEAGHCSTFVGTYWVPAAMQTTEEDKLAEGQGAVWRNFCFMEVSDSW